MNEMRGNSHIINRISNICIFTLLLLFVHMPNGSARNVQDMPDTTTEPDAIHTLPDTLNVAPETIRVAADTLPRAIPDTLNVVSDTLCIASDTVRAVSDTTYVLSDTPGIPDSTIITSLGVIDMLSDSIYTIGNSRVKPPGKKRPKVNIYDMPYSMKEGYTNHKMLWINTGVLFCAGVATLGVLQVMPEGATAWNKEKISEVPFWKRWGKNVKKGPVWDKDNFVFNYVLHPYGGAVYYMGARSQGANVFHSFLYSTFVSTVMWEYGIEAFMEIPSIQDLIVTPTTGLILGEGFYLLKRHIVKNDYKLFGSGFLGNFMAYLVDPVNEVIGIFAGNPNRKKYKAKARAREEASLACTPWMGRTKNGNIGGFALSLSF